MEMTVDHEVTLKQISEAYAEELHSLVGQSLKGDLGYWCPDLKKTYATLGSTVAHIRDAHSKYLEDRTPDLLIIHNGTLAGLISLSPLYHSGTQSEIGYWLGDDFVGQGLVTRSFPKILEYANDRLGLASVELSTAVPNERSQRLPRRFGFIQIKINPKAEVLESGPVDHILWRLEF